LGVSCVIEEFSIDYLENEKLFKLDIKEPIPKRNIGYCHLKDIEITKDKEGTELKEFGSTHIKDNMIYVPQVEAYIDLNSIK
ncbi:hypothetical protein ACTPD5_21635, partial [Clostridioides difficile]